MYVGVCQNYTRKGKFLLYLNYILIFLKNVHKFYRSFSPMKLLTQGLYFYRVLIFLLPLEIVKWRYVSHLK